MRAKRPTRGGAEGASGLYLAMRGKRPTHPADADALGALRGLEGLLGRLAARQHGVVCRAQLLEIGFSSAAIHRRVKAGALRPLHRGVYLVGPVAPPLASQMAAVLACGERTFLSHGSASHIQATTPYLPNPRTPHVTVVERDPRPAGINVHRVRFLAPDETTTHRNIPITTPARTLLDLAPSLTPRQLERSLAEAVRRRIVRPAALEALLARHPARPGVPALRALLHSDPAFTRSELEERFLALIREAGLPEPEANAELGPYEIDFLWRDERLAVEVDSWSFHSDRKAFEDDRRRDAELVSWGFRVIRITWRQICDEPVMVAVRLAGAMAA
jgi:very-short-patch-repair endonuclease